jgi:hypothetical protein
MNKKVTNVNKKLKDRPKTQKEKLERLEKINPALSELIDVLGLDVNL